MNNIDIRKKKMLSVLAKKDISNDVLCSVALAQLAINQKNNETINKRIIETAEWFSKTVCPFMGRDPQGEPDFAALKLIRILYSFGDVISPKTKEKVISFFVENDFESKYKSENHMLIFHTSRYLFSQIFPDYKNKVYGRLFSEILLDDKKFLIDYLKFRLENGWAEFDSLGYYCEDIRSLVTLYDFTNDDEIRDLARQSIDFLLIDMINDCMGTLYCGAHGRIYQNEAFDQKNSDMLSIYWLCFGNEYEKLCLDMPVIELCLSTFVPSDSVYCALKSKPLIYESFESHPLHYITEQPPQRQLEFLGGYINKYTYITQKYAIGAVNFQDDYPEGCEAAWYAHHQQHEWELTISGGTDIKIFTHHPGKFGTEGAEHGRWTGDLGCCCGNFFCSKEIAVAMYDIKNGLNYINANIPFKYFEMYKYENYLFLKHKNAYVSLWFSNGYNKTEGEYSERELISCGNKHAVVCHVALPEKYKNFQCFCNNMKSRKITFDAENMTLSYENIYIDKYIRKLNGEKVVFPYPTLKIQ